MTIPEIFIKLTSALDVKNLNELPGAWQQKIDETWYVAINGQSTDVDVEPAGGMKITLPPYHFAVWFNGWIAGLIYPLGGGVFAAGSGANEFEFIIAVEDFLLKVAS